MPHINAQLYEYFIMTPAESWKMLLVVSLCAYAAQHLFRNCIDWLNVKLFKR
jgi:hypothetical protein